MMNNAYAILNTSPRRRAILMWLLIAPIFFLGGCARHHHYLARYDFQGQTLALDAPYAPVPRIITDVEGDVVGGVASRSVGGLFRAATSIAKEAHAEKARRRLDRAADSVDVSMLIAEEALPRAARYMGAIPSEDLDRSDFVMILRINNHGIYAGRSFNGGMEYFVDARVELIDNHSGRLVWKRDVGVQEPLNDGGFYLFDHVRNAKALSELSEEELRDALERLSRYTAECITRTLANDLR